jgi:uncharacterized damage-inducible protein DinB
MRYDVSPALGTEREIGVLVATWQDGTREWLDNLGEPTAEALTWQPFEGGPSIGGIMLHMAGCDHYWISEFVNNRPQDPESPALQYNNKVDQDNVSWSTPPAEPFAWYLNQLQSVRGPVVEQILSHPEPNQEFQRTWGALTFKWIVAHLVEHDSYHGGQCVLLHELWKKTQAK